jgi:phospholipid/cholesterol/gamma-HCH transport system substrate-binding protein
VALIAGAYILIHERLQSPFANNYNLSVQLSAADAVTPGLGEAVNVAGVRVGQITGVKLSNGLGIVKVSIDPGKLRHVWTNAQAVLVPNTPLKDMQIDLSPGGPPGRVLKAGGTIPVRATTTPINSDELLGALDADTRSWFESLVTDLSGGIHGRGLDLRRLLAALQPTAVQLRSVSDLLAQRRRQLSRLVHNLALLSRAAGSKDREIATVVSAGNATLGALASQDVALRTAVGRLPGTLATARATLADVTPLAGELGPTLTALMPTARRLKPTLEDTRTLFRGVALLPLEQTPKFVAASTKVAADIGPATRDISAQTPALTDAFKVAAYTTNEAAYNPGGANQGFLYWFSWFSHNAASMLSTQDAHGAVWRGLALVSCSSLTSPGGLGQVLGLLTNLHPVCP